MIYVDVRILHKRFPGKYDHIQSGRVGVTAEDLGISQQRMLSFHAGGPGTELKKILSLLGIKPEKGCACAKRARYMDRMGCDWCEENMDTIVRWLKEEHERRKLLVPFSDLIARQVVKLAIKRARKANSK